MNFEFTSTMNERAWKRHKPRERPPRPNTRQHALGYGVISFDNNGEWSVKFRDNYFVSSDEQVVGKDANEARQRATAAYFTLYKFHKNP